MNTARFARNARRSVLFYLLLGAVIVIFLFPFYWGLITSLKFEVDIYDFSGNFLVPKRPSDDVAHGEKHGWRCSKLVRQPES